MNVHGIGERQIHLTVAGLTDTGRKREENQDHFLVADLGTAPGNGGILLSPDAQARGAEGATGLPVGPKGALLVVADGMGGAAAGGLASTMAVAWIYEELVTHWRAERRLLPQYFATGLRAAVVAANARIHEHAQAHPECHGMGSTATAVGILDGVLYLAQVGDSRAYLVRHGEAVQLTRDQSLVQQLIDAGTLTEEEAGRSHQRNLILQALGTRPEVQVDLTWQEVRRGDVVVLCSDGLSGLVRREEIAHAVERTPDMDALCATLVDTANERGGGDNITVIAARFDGDGLDDPSEDDVVGRRPYDLPDPQAPPR